MQQCVQGGEEATCACRSPRGDLQVAGRKGDGAAGSIQALETDQAVLHQQGERQPVCRDQLLLYPGDTAQTRVFPAEKNPNRNLVHSDFCFGFFPINAEKAILLLWVYGRY